MFGLHIFPEPNPTGRIDATKQDNYNIQFRKPDAKLMINEDITGNYFRQEKDIPPQYPYHYKIHHESVTMNLNNLQNFNSTSPGITYFEPHETERHFHNSSHGSFKSHPANKTTPNHRDNTVTDKIDKWRKASNVFEKPEEHSMKLKIVKV